MLSSPCRLLQRPFQFHRLQPPEVTENLLFKSCSSGVCRQLCRAGESTIKFEIAEYTLWTIVQLELLVKTRISHD